MNIDAKTELYGIIGWPVGHSLSPAMHNAAFGHFGLNACYVPLPVPQESLAQAAEGVRAFGFRGVNVTVPHKVGIIDYLDGLEGYAEELSAVNVIRRNDDTLTGLNTDVDGFRLSLEEAGVEVAGKRVVMVGAGGAGRSVVRALQDARAGEVIIMNRTHAKAEAVAEAAGAPEVRAVRFSDNEAIYLLRDCAILINATSLGLKEADPAPLETSFVHEGQTLVDLIYRPAKTRFLAEGEMRGARIVNGYGMLVFQAREAFKIWTGLTPPVGLMWDAGIKELDQGR